MKFNELTDEQQQKLHDEILQNALKIGGKNSFLSMIEDIRATKPNPLLNKTGIFHYSNGRIIWEKAIYKDTLTLLLDSLKKFEKDGSLVKGLNPRKYKTTTNMMKTLKPIKIKISPKNKNSGEGFEFPIFDKIDGENSTISIMFKIIFFYNIDFAKKVLSFKK